MPKYSLHQTLFRGRNDRKPADGDSAYNTPLLESPQKTNHMKFSSLPTPLVSPSPSMPSIAFPTKETPAPSPTSPRRRALTIHMGCGSANSLQDEDAPYAPKHMPRCPTLNMLRNIRRTGSPSPRAGPPPEYLSTGSHPAGSSRASSPVQITRPPSELSVEVGRMAVSDPFPPVLTLPNEGTMDMGLGWADEFGMMIDTRAAPPRPWSTTFSHSSRQTSWSQPSRPPSRHSVRDYPTSSMGFFSSNSVSFKMPSPLTVMEAAEARHARPSSPNDDPFIFRDPDITSHDDVEPSPAVRFLEHYELPSPPPRLGFQLRRSSEDWASAVLKAIGTPVEAN